MQYMTISETAELTGLTHRALRFYEERGLVTPVRDRASRRMYDLESRRDLLIVANLRRVNVPLNDIGEVLEARDQGAVVQQQLARKKVLAVRARLALKMAEIDAAVGALDREFL